MGEYTTTSTGTSTITANTGTITTSTYTINPYTYATTGTSVLNSWPVQTIQRTQHFLKSILPNEYRIEYDLSKDCYVLKTKNTEEKKENMNTLITNIKIPKSNPRIVIFTFADKTVIKTFCDERDEFSLEFACILAYAKKLYSNQYTSQGIYLKAKNELQYDKNFIRQAKEAIKKYKLELKEQEKKIEYNKKIKEEHVREQERNVARKRRQREKRIEELAEAIKKANN